MRMADSKIRIQLVDDHALVRAGFRAILEDNPSFEVVSESDNGLQAVRDFIKHRPHVVMMDVAMPVLGGLEAMRKILAKDASARIIVLSMLDDNVARMAIEAGAMGFLSKLSAAYELVFAINKVIQGERYIDSETAKIVALGSLAKGGNALNTLSLREYEILMQIVNGNSVEDIAGNLCISPKTVRSHKSHIMKKLDVANMVDLVRLAMREGLIQGG